MGAASAFGQGFRYDSNITTTATNVPPGAQAPIFSVPYGLVTVCAAPATPTGTVCTNTVPIYSDAGLTQVITQPMAASSQGTFGFYAPAGNYFASYQSQAGTYLGTFGLQIGSGSNGGGYPWPDVSDFPGSSTAARAAAASASLPSGVGVVAIPPDEQAYNQTTNTMLPNGQSPTTFFDFRSLPASGTAPCTGSYTNWPSGGVLLYDGSDEIAKNHFCFPYTARFEVSDYYQAGNFSSTLTNGLAGMGVDQIIDGTVPAGLAVDGMVSHIWGLQGLNTSAGRGFLTAHEVEDIIQGTASNGGVGTHMDLYNIRGADR